MLSTLLGLIGTAGSIYSNSSTNIANQNLNLQNMQHQSQMLGMQQQWAAGQAQAADERQRQLYNDLYSPAARKQQLEDAGLSVGMMYGAGGAQGTGGTGGNMAPTPSLEPRQTIPAQNILDANAANILAKAAKTEAETQNIKQDTKNKQTQEEQIDATTDQIKKNIEKTEQDIKESKAKIENYQHDNAAKDAATRYNNAMAGIQEIRLIYEGELNQWELNKLQKEWEIMAENAKKIGIENEILEKTKNDQIKMIVQQAAMAEIEKLTKEYYQKNIQPKEKEQIEADIKRLEALATQTQWDNKSQEEMENAFMQLGMNRGQAKIVAYVLKSLLKPR